MKIREPVQDSARVKYLNQEYIIPKRFKTNFGSFVESSKLLFPCEKCKVKTHILSAWKLSHGHRPSHKPNVISEGKWKMFCSEQCMNEWINENKVRLITEEI